MFRKAYLWFIFFSLWLPSLSQTIDLHDGLVLHLPLRGNANDLSGNENNGIVNGATPAIGRKGDEAGAMFFNGGANITIPNSESLNFNDVYSFSIWVNTPSFNAEFHTLISKGPEPSESYGLFVRRDRGLHSVLRITGTNGTTLRYHRDTPGVVSVDSWHHVVHTYDGTHSTVYVDGQIAGEFSIPGKIDPNGFDLSIGVRPGSIRRFPLVGSLSDVRMYNRVLTDEEIDALFQLDEAPPLDAGLANFSISDFSVVNEGINELSVELKNFGLETIRSAAIDWKVNGMSQPKVSWAGELGFSETVSVTLGSHSFNPGLVYKIEATLESANGIVDTNLLNDTTELNKIFVIWW